MRVDAEYEQGIQLPLLMLALARQVGFSQHFPSGTGVYIFQKPKEGNDFTIHF